MTIMDAQNVFDQNTLATSWIVGANNSANVIDTGPLSAPNSPLAANTGRNLGAGEDVVALIVCTAAFTSGGAATLQASLVSSAASTLTSPQTIFATAVIPKATLVAGYILAQFTLPRGLTSYLQYLGIIYTVGVAVFTAGTVIAALIKDSQDKDVYVKAFLVD